MTATIYEKTAFVDEETGLPSDYHSFYAAYQPLLVATARRVGIPDQDADDAAAEVAIKFWRKDGLAMYDPERGTKFATLLRNWASLFLLQERDKVKKVQRYPVMDPTLITAEETSVNVSAEDHVLYDTQIQQWAYEAETA